MFVKNILKAFDSDVPLVYIIGDRHVIEYDTVGKYMESGLTTYDNIEQPLTIKDNKIIIKI